MKNPLFVILLGGTLLMLFSPACPVAAAQGNANTANETDLPSEVTLPPGAVISVRLADTVNSSHNHSGDLITGTVDPSVLVDNRVVIPRGTEAHLRLMQDKKGGRIHGKAAVRLELVALVL